MKDLAQQESQSVHSIVPTVLGALTGLTFLMFLYGFAVTIGYYGYFGFEWLAFEVTKQQYLYAGFVPMLWIVVLGMGSFFIFRNKQELWILKISAMFVMVAQIALFIMPFYTLWQLVPIIIIYAGLGLWIMLFMRFSVRPIIFKSYRAERWILLVSVIVGLGIIGPGASVFFGKTRALIEQRKLPQVKSTRSNFPINAQLISKVENQYFVVSSKPETNKARFFLNVNYYHAPYDLYALQGEELNMIVRD